MPRQPKSASNANTAPDPAASAHRREKLSSGITRLADDQTADFFKQSSEQSPQKKKIVSFAPAIPSIEGPGRQRPGTPSSSTQGAATHSERSSIPDPYQDSTYVVAPMRSSQRRERTKPAVKRESSEEESSLADIPETESDPPEGGKVRGGPQTFSQVTSNKPAISSAITTRTTSERTHRRTVIPSSSESQSPGATEKTPSSFGASEPRVSETLNNTSDDYDDE